MGKTTILQIISKWDMGS